MADIIADGVDKIVNSVDGEFNIQSGDREIGLLTVNKQGYAITITNPKLGRFHARYKLIENGVEFYNVIGHYTFLGIDLFPLDFIRVTSGRFGTVHVRASTRFPVPGRFSVK